MDEHKIAQWLANALKNTGITQTELAAEVGLTQDKISNVIRGRRDLSVREALKISAYLKVALPGAESLVQVSGQLGHSSYIETVEPFYADAALAGASGHVQAVEVATNNWVPTYECGDLLLYDNVPIDPGKNIGGFALVHVGEGRRIIGKISRGESPDVFDLSAPVGPDIKGVEIVVAYPLVARLTSKAWSKKANMRLSNNSVDLDI